ncbi:MAG: hypothetical protein EHM57_07700 [Actinobacteria bacterium]|nr:MAG: hypothetical protein EHM57_07700 [Actinomycetota bacterium]
MAYERSPSAFAFTREYIFKHALLHDVVYESVVRRLRRGYHREAANWLIAAGGDRAAEFASQIAEHFVEAGDDVAAIEWLVRAGTEAKSTHAPVAAAKAFGLALQLAAGTSDPAVAADRRAALGGLGDVLTVQARYEEAVDTYRALRDDAAAEGDQLSVARAESGIAAAETYQGHLRDAVDSALRAREAARRGGERNEEARAAWLQAWASLRLGMVAEATDLAADVLALSADGDRAMCAEALNLQGVIAYSGGSYDMATAHFDEAASVFEEIGNVEKVMPLLNNIGVIAEARGDYESAEKSYREALAIARETGSRDGELVYASNLGGTLVALGRAEEGESELRRVIELATDGLSVLPETYRFLTDSLLAQGRVTEAAEAAVTSLRLALDSEAPDYIAAAWRALGQVASRSGGSVVVRLDRAPGSYDAEQCFAASMRTADEIDSDGDRARTLAAWAVHERRAGGPSDGGGRAARARELFSGLGAEREVVRLDEALAVVGGVDR